MARSKVKLKFLIESCVKASVSDRGIRCYVRRHAVKSADDILGVIKSSEGAAAGEGRSRTTPLRSQAARLMMLLHKYARENLLVANIYIKDPAVTLIKRDQKIPVIWEGHG